MKSGKALALATQPAARALEPQAPRTGRPSVKELLQPFDALMETCPTAMHYENTRLPPSGASLALAKSAEQALAPYARPATAEEVCTIMERLRLHWDDWKAWTPEEAEMAAEDWIEDLAGVPVGALIEAARDWRQAGKTKPPNSGQLLAAARAGPIKLMTDCYRRIEALREWYERAQSGALFAELEENLASWEAASNPDYFPDKWRDDRERHARIAQFNVTNIRFKLDPWKQRVAERLKAEGLEYSFDVT